MSTVSDRARRATRRADAERNDRALLRAAREVIAIDGMHASVAAIAARAGVGIGSLYRRWRSKEELFRHLTEVALDEWTRVGEEGLALDDPWEGLAHYFNAAVEFGPGTLAPLAGTIEIGPEAAERLRRSDDAGEALVARAHSAGVLRADVTAVDLWLLVEQFGRSPLIEQLTIQGRDDLDAAALHARRRLVAIVLDGLRPKGAPLPAPAPDPQLLYGRWAPLP
jgi:AcrR family transcriptional regulator